MKVRNLLVLFLAVTFATACSAQDDTATDDAADMADASGDAEALDALTAGYVEHYNMGHADVVAANYVDDAVTVYADGGVNLGRAEIEAALTATMAGSPTLRIDPDEIHLGGDKAVARGTWGISVPVEGADPMTTSGHYMTLFTRVEGEWKIMVVASNYDSEQPPEAHMGALSENLDDEEDDGMDGLMTAYEEAWAAGDAAAVGMLYTENAHASFASQPALEGRAAIEEVLAERMAGTVDIHAKGTIPLDDGWAVNGGWYETMDDSGHSVGNYLLLAKVTEDGGHQIHWLVGNGRPAPEE
ncbi:MAG: nuclear transport factor 2 family protein [Gemmatimonadota bacterium]